MNPFPIPQPLAPLIEEQTRRLLELRQRRAEMDAAAARQLGTSIGTGIGQGIDSASKLQEQAAAIQAMRQAGLIEPGQEGAYTAAAKAGMALPIMDPLTRRQKTAEAEKDEEQAALYRTQGDYLANVGGDQSGMPNIVTDPSTGMQFIKTDTKSGPRFTPVQGQVATTEDKVKSTLANSGVKALDKIKQMVSEPGGWELVLKAGGKLSSLGALGDGKAQKLRRLIIAAGDAESRLKTGAAMTKDEQELYFNELVDRMQTMEANIYGIDLKREFMTDFLDNMTTTRRADLGGRGGAKGGADAKAAARAKLGLK